MGDLTANEFFKLTTKDSSEVVLCIAVDQLAKTTFCISSQTGDQFLQHSKEKQNFDLLKNLQQFLSGAFLIDDLKLVVKNINVSKTERKQGRKTETKNEKLGKRRKLFSGKHVSEESCLKSRSGRKIKPPKWLIERRNESESDESSAEEGENEGGTADDEDISFSETASAEENKGYDESKMFPKSSLRVTKKSESLSIKKIETQEPTNELELSCLRGSDFDKNILEKDMDIEDFKPVTINQLDEFKGQHQLKEHDEIQGQPQHPCDICGKKFCLPTYLQRHKFETHKMPDNLEIKVDNSEMELEVPHADEQDSPLKGEENGLSREESEIHTAIEDSVMEGQNSNLSDKTISSKVVKSISSTQSQSIKTESSGNSDEDLTATESVSVCHQINDMVENGQNQHVCDQLNSEQLSIESENKMEVADSTQKAITLTSVKDHVTKKLKCNTCTATFASKFNLSRHLRRKNDCGRGKDFVITKHVDERNAESLQTKDSGKLSCHECTESFFSDFERIRHELAVHDLLIAERYDGPARRGKFKCPICKTKRESIRTLKLHVKSHYEMDALELTCHVCKMQFKTKNRLQNHLMIHSEPTIPCNICGKKFRLMKYVKRHIAEFHKKVPDIYVPKKERAKQVPREKKNPTPGMCDICGKVFQSSYKALQHRSSHESQKNIPCPVCGKMFGQQRTLKTHMKIHGEARDYVCEVCGKAFKISQGLRMHKLRYHDKTEYKCDLCDRKFLSGSGKKYHMFKDHKEFAMKNDDLKKFPCKYCDRVCSGSQEYLRHLSRHEDNKNKFCDICKRGFSTVSQLNVHRKVHFAQVKRFACKICRFKTLTPYKLKRHLASSKHIESCLAVGITNVSMATDFDNSSIVDQIPGKNSDVENNFSATADIDQSDVEYQDETNVVTIEMHDNEAGEQIGEEVEVKYLEIPDNLEASQIIYTDNAEMIYSVIQEADIEGTSTFIFDPSVNQAVESILKLQKS